MAAKRSDFPAALVRTVAAWPWGRIARRTLWGLLATTAAVVLTIGLAAAWYYPQLPPLDRVTDYQPRQPLQVFTREGTEIAQFGAEHRIFTPLAQIPPLLQQAVVAVEDARFREHGGIDPRGIARALLADLTGGMRQGASTITQQVARTFFLSSRLSFERKVKEALLALKIEQQLSKDQILELYLNQIYLGQRSYGFAAAADTYFGKPLYALSVAEVAMLAGLPQNPGYANPITNLARAVQRQHVVLARMVATGVITEAQAAAARAEPLRIRSPLQVAVHAEHVADIARRAVVERFGTEVYSQGIRVYTSVAAADQQASWLALRRGVLAYDARQPWRGPEDHEVLPPEGADPDAVDRAAAQALRDHADDEMLRVAVVLHASPAEVVAQLATGEQVRVSGDGLREARPGLGAKAGADLALTRGAIIRVMASGDRPSSSTNLRWSIVQWPEVQAAFVALDAQTGRVRALVGGFDFARSPFNHVTQAWRQPGSSIKPFLYSAALEDGVMPTTLVNDEPLRSADGWDPKNADGEYDSPLTLRQGLAHSKNLVSIRVLRHVGVPPALAWLGRFGFDTAKQPDNLTLALGAGSTTPMQLAQAYAVFANGGWRVSPVLIERITDAQGKVLFEAPAPEPHTEEDRAVPARNVFVIDSLLNDVTRIGTAARAQQQLKRPDVYGKTGTTNEAVDAWFAGFGGGIAAVAWMGYDDPRSLGPGGSGAGQALPIWIDYMATALKNVPVAEPPTPPEGVVEVDGDWRYSEFADGGYVQSIGLDAAPDAGASAPASAPSSPSG
jgi:penicillin-binding protein 1A